MHFLHCPERYRGLWGGRWRGNNAKPISGKRDFLFRCFTGSPAITPTRCPGRGARETGQETATPLLAGVSERLTQLGSQAPMGRHGTQGCPIPPQPCQGGRRPWFPGPALRERRLLGPAGGIPRFQKKLAVAFVQDCQPHPWGWGSGRAGQGALWEPGLCAAGPWTGSRHRMC